MSTPASVLLLHEPGPVPTDLAALADALKAQGAVVELQPCGEPYASVLQAMARCDKVIYWRPE